MFRRSIAILLCLALLCPAAFAEDLFLPEDDPEEMPFSLYELENEEEPAFAVLTAEAQDYALLYTVTGDTAVITGFTGTLPEELTLPTMAEGGEVIGSIGDRAFYGSETLRSVEVPYTVLSIGEEAFGEGVRIICSYNSAAYDWAKANGRSYTLRLPSVRITSVEARDASSVKISWTAAPMSDCLEGYYVEYAKGALGNWKAIDCGSATSCEISGLTNKQEWAFRVRAYADGVKGSYSEIASLFLLPTVTNLQAVTGEAYFSADLSWTGRADASYYEVFMSDREEGPYESIGIRYDTTYAVTGLTPGTYWFGVRAYFSFYDGSSAMVKASAKVVSPKPADLSASRGEFSDVVNLAWSEAEGADEYQVLMTKGDGDDWETVLTTADTCCTLEGLTGGDYRFTVRAAFGEIVSEPCESVSLRLTGGAPDTADAVRDGNGIRIFWSETPETLKYQVFYSYEADGDYSLLGETETCEYIAGPLTEGDVVYFRIYSCADRNERVYAVCSFDNSIVPIAPTPAPGDPNVLTAPAGLTCAQETETKVVLSWREVPNADAYKICYRMVGGEWKSMGYTTALKVGITKLRTGGSYEFRICAAFAEYDREGNCTYADGPFCDEAGITLETAFSLLYEIAEEGAVVAGWRSLTGSCASNVAIPENVEISGKTYPVTAIGELAFASSTLDSITLPEGLLTIGEGAFSNCDSLVSVQIPESVMSIGDLAFQECSALTRVTLPEGLLSVGSYAFADCASLRTITIPEHCALAADAFTETACTVGVYRGSQALTACRSGGVDRFVLSPVEDLTAKTNLTLDEEGIAQRADLTVSWAMQEGAKGYEVTVCLPEGDITRTVGEFGDTTSTPSEIPEAITTTFSDVPLAETLTVRVTALSGEMRSDSAETSCLTSLRSVGGVTTASVYGGDITLEWDTGEGATGYTVYCEKIDRTYKSTENSINMTGFAPGRYTFTVTAENNLTGEKTRPSEAASALCLGQAEITDAWEGCVLWDRVPNAESYEIAFSADGVVYTMSATVEGTYSSLRAKGYCRVRAAATAYGTTSYGAWSEPVSITSLGTTPTAAAVKADGSATILWNAVDDADGYIVLASGSKAGPYTAIADVTGTKTTETVTGTARYYKIRAWKNVGDQKAYGDASAVVQMTVFGTIGEVMAVRDNKTVNVGWTKSNGAQGYTLQRSAGENGPWTSIKSVTANSTQTAAPTEGTYWYRVRPYILFAGAKVFGDASKPVSITELGAITSVAAVKDGKTINLGWTKVPGAGGYSLLRSTTKSGTYTGQKSITSNTTTSAAPTEGTYWYKIRPYVTVDGVRVYGSMSAAVSITELGAIDTVKAVLDGKSVNLGWTASTGASGYSLMRSTTKSGTYTSLKSITTTTTSTAAPAEGTYWYKIRPYVTVDGVKVYGSASQAVNILVIGSVTGVKAVNAGSNVNLGWTKAVNAEGYTLYRSTTKTGTYTAIKSQTGNTAATTAPASGTYWFKVRPYVTVGSQKIYGSMSAASSMTTLKALSITSITAGTTSVTLNWTNIAADGYTVYKGQSGTFTAVKSITTVKTSVSSLKSGASYSFKIRPYLLIDGIKVYGNYSAVKTIKTK